eukprot:15965401-Heterocapsa_arctica.AAC.1
MDAYHVILYPLRHGFRTRSVRVYARFVLDCSRPPLPVASPSDAMYCACHANPALPLRRWPT